MKDIKNESKICCQKVLIKSFQIKKKRNHFFSIWTSRYSLNIEHYGNTFIWFLSGTGQSENHKKKKNEFPRGNFQ